MDDPKDKKTDDDNTEKQIGDKKPDRGSGCLIASLSAMILLPVLYFLSTGPVIVILFFIDQQVGLPRWTQSVLEGIYFPLIWLAENNETFEGIVESYTSWWTSVFLNLP